MELLIKKAQKGDEEAFIQAITEYMPQIYKVAKTRLKSEDDIGDAIQDTILSAYQSITQLRQPSYFKTWITKILINKCNDIVQKNSRVTYVQDVNQVPTTENTMTYSNLDEQLDFEAVLNTLGEDYKTVITLYYVNGFTSREIAKILNEKEGTIKSKLSRARQKLRNYYLSENETQQVLNRFLWR